MFGKHWLLIIKMKLLDLNLKSELFGQVGGLHQEVPFSQIIDLASSIIKHWQLVRHAGLPVLVTALLLVHIALAL